MRSAPRGLYGLPRAILGCNSPSERASLGNFLAVRGSLGQKLFRPKGFFRGTHGWKLAIFAIAELHIFASSHVSMFGSAHVLMSGQTDIRVVTLSERRVTLPRQGLPNLESRLRDLGKAYLSSATRPRKRLR